MQIEIRRSENGEWSLDGDPLARSASLIDLDLGFTPATNLIAIRRLGLGIGAASDAPAAWLDVEEGRLDALAQRYERRSESGYWYQAPAVGYQALLEVDAIGFVRHYPGLWTAVR